MKVSNNVKNRIMVLPGIDEIISAWKDDIFWLALSHPIDTIKVRQQNYGVNPIQAIKSTYTYERLRGFYKGVPVALLTAIPSQYMFVKTFSSTLKFIHDNEEEAKLIDNFSPSTENFGIFNVGISGFIAGVTHGIVTCPIEVVTTLSQVNTEGKGPWTAHYRIPYRSAIHCITEIYRNQGMKMFFRGCIPAAIKQGPCGAFYTIAQEMLTYSTDPTCETPFTSTHVVTGLVAGLVTWFISVPFDVVRVRLQSDNPDNPKYYGMIHCFKKVFREGGWVALNRGLLLITLKGIVSNASIYLGIRAADICIK